MNPPSVDIKDIIESISSLGLAFAINLFVSEIPTTPDECVCIYDSGGDDPEPGFNYERPHVQIRVRGDRGRYGAAHELAQAIRDELNGRANYTINEARYIGIWAMGDIMYVGYDDNQRPLLTVNFRIHRTNA